MKAKRTRKFDAALFLATIGDGRKIITFKKGKTIFAQGDPTDSVFYVQRGKIKLTVVSHAGKGSHRGSSREKAVFSGKAASLVRLFGWARPPR